MGPLLFNIYVNDIPSLTDSQTLIFADNTQMLYTTSGTISPLQRLLPIIGRNKITVNDIIRDPGVMVDSHLKFHNHVNYTMTKVNHSLGLINRTLQYRRPEMIIKLYLVRPQLKYSNTIWGPYYITNQKSIEGVQKYATKMIPILVSILINRDSSS